MALDGHGDAVNWDIRRESWNGAVPVCFTLARPDIVTVQLPAPYCSLVSRNSYFPLILAAVKEHFAPHVEPLGPDEEIWLDSDGTALKWHVPVGVLFDLYANPATLPWNITVNYKRYPAQELLRSESKDRDLVQQNFTMMVKEAECMRTGSAKKIMNLTRVESTQLWDSIVRQEFDAYWRVMTPNWSSGATFKLLPIRVYIRDVPEVFQEAITPINADGATRTVLEYLCEVLPPAMIGVDARGTRQLSGLQVVVHGVAAELDAPVTWLVENMTHPDTWVHVVIKQIA